MGSCSHFGSSDGVSGVSMLVLPLVSLAHVDGRLGAVPWLRPPRICMPKKALSQLGVDGFSSPPAVAPTGGWMEFGGDVVGGERSLRTRWGLASLAI